MKNWNFIETSLMMNSPVTKYKNYQWDRNSDKEGGVLRGHFDWLSIWSTILIKHKGGQSSLESAFDKVSSSHIWKNIQLLGHKSKETLC